jgi:hypothetical protein
MNTYVLNYESERKMALLNFLPRISDRMNFLIIPKLFWCVSINFIFAGGSIEN